MPPEGSWASQLDERNIGDDIFALAAEIYPICRSITGDGVRETLAHLARHIKITVHEVPTGTQVFDWAVPREWNIRDAYIKDSRGEKIVDFSKSNLHVMSYSVPVHKRLSLAELTPHIHTLPDQPNLIPYRTSYYAENWGFCMAHRQFTSLREETYEVLIDATLEPGSLTYGEYLHKGETEDEFLFSAHVCHPSLADDNCSGLALLTQLAKRLAPVKTRLSYRFLFAPGTIGAITWLARNENRAGRIRHGLVMSCVGDSGGPVYKKSRRGTAMIDRAVSHVLKQQWPHATVCDFSPYGYDERQFCSPGFDLPVGLFQRSQFGTFPEYHTSADNLDFISPENLASSYGTICSAIDIIENDRRFINTQPKCEPQLGKRGLYAAIGGDKDAPKKHMALLWVLNLSDGEHSLLDISERADMPFAIINDAARLLAEMGLLVLARGDDKNS
jgi:aminopeptidase-like protein